MYGANIYICMHIYIRLYILDTEVVVCREGHI